MTKKEQIFSAAERDIFVKIYINWVTTWAVFFKKNTKKDYPFSICIWRGVSCIVLLVAARLIPTILLTWDFS